MDYSNIYVKANLTNLNQDIHVTKLLSKFSCSKKSIKLLQDQYTNYRISNTRISKTVSVQLLGNSRVDQYNNTANSLNFTHSCLIALPDILNNSKQAKVLTNRNSKQDQYRNSATSVKLMQESAMCLESYLHLHQVHRSTGAVQQHTNQQNSISTATWQTGQGK